jgi:hypothetical protein
LKKIQKASLMAFEEQTYPFWATSFHTIHPSGFGFDLHKGVEGVSLQNLSLYDAASGLFTAGGVFSGDVQVV